MLELEFQILISSLGAGRCHIPGRDHKSAIRPPCHQHRIRVHREALVPEPMQQQKRVEGRLGNPVFGDQPVSAVEQNQPSDAGTRPRIEAAKISFDYLSKV